MRRPPVNLATHPIEARRRARRILLLAVAAVVVVTAAHGTLAWRLAAAGAVEPAPRAEVVPELLARWDREVDDIAGVATSAGVGATAEAVMLANELIDRRAFPWSELFGVLEDALPDDVRLELVQPVGGADGVRVSMVAASRSRQSLLEFLGDLEASAQLTEVYPVRREQGEDGQWRLTVQARHRGRRVPGPGGRP